MIKQFRIGKKHSFFAGYSLAPNKERQWILYLPESGADFIRGSRTDLKQLVGSNLVHKFNFLVVNKAGLLPLSTHHKIFELGFRRQKRIDDALLALNSIIPKNHLVHVIGYSEGAYLAPQLAIRSERVKSVVMIGGGTRGWLKEELSNAGPRQRSALMKQIREILKSPKSHKKWNGFSFATWHSYKDDDTLAALQILDLPTLAILGARDKTIDFKSAFRDLKRMAHQRKTLKLKVFSQCGHSFVNHWADARFEIQKFLRPITK